MTRARFGNMTTAGLLASFAAILTELRRRDVVRSSNNPVADYAEGLAAKALKLRLVNGSTAGYDAVDSRGRRYEIKARRFTQFGKTTQFSAIRGLKLGHFDSLVGILFNEDFTVRRAVLIPRRVVERFAVFREHGNGSILPIKDVLWETRGVDDITLRVARAQGE